MSQLVPVSKPSGQRTSARRISHRHGETSNTAADSVNLSQRQVDQLQETPLVTPEVRIGEADRLRGSTSLGQVIAFLIELADKDALDCAPRE